MIRRELSTLALAGGVAIAFAAGCKSAPEPVVGVSDRGGATAPIGRAVSYVFDSLDDRAVSSAAMQGKPSVIVFVTTGDLVGQAQVDYLVAMAKNDRERVNYALVAIHPRREIVLVEAYAKALSVDFPVALADASVTSTSGPFGEIAAVPTVVILDRNGRLVWMHTGLAKSDELRSHMRGL